MSGVDKKFTLTWDLWVVEGVEVTVYGVSLSYIGDQVTWVWPLNMIYQYNYFGVALCG